MTRRFLDRRALFAVCLLLGSALPAAAPTWPSLMNYQAQLTDSAGQAVADGSYSVKFNLYTVATGGSNIWSETQSVTVSKGLFNAILGSTTAQGLGVLPASTFNNDLWVGITVNGDPEMSPRQQLLGPVNANNAQTVGGYLPNNTASNLVVLDSGGKIPAGLVQGGSIQFPFSMAGSSAYGLSVVNASAVSSAVGLSVVASSGIQSWATDAAGIGVVGTTGGGTSFGVLGVNTNVSSGEGVEGLGFIGVQGQATQNSGRGVEGDVSATVSGAIGVLGTNANASGTAISGRHLGNGAGMGVRGSSASGQGAVGVYGVVSGTGGAGGAIAVEGFSSQPDSFGVVGLQTNGSGAPYPYAGVRGYTAGLGLGIGVLGEGNQGVYGNSGGLCGVCAVNQNAFSGSGLSATSPLQGIVANATNTSNPGFGITASIVSTANGSAAGVFQAQGTSGQVDGIDVSNASASGIAVKASGGHDAVHAVASAGGTNFSSDAANQPAFGFYHSDPSPPSQGVGVYAAENCGDCFGGEFINTAATTGSGGALNVQGRLTVNQSAGTFSALAGATTFQLNNSYITPNCLVFLTVASPVSSVAAVTAKAAGNATIIFSPALAINTTYQFLIIGQ